MNKAELVDSLVARPSLKHLSKKDAETIVNELIDIIRSSVRNGDDVSLTGFGTFTKSERAARTGVNPSTGEKIQISAKTLPKFRPGKAWKEMFAS